MQEHVATRGVGMPAIYRSRVGLTPRVAPCLAQPTREYVRPDNQLALSDAQLGEEIPRMLTANNPVAPKNLARRARDERGLHYYRSVHAPV